MRCTFKRLEIDVTLECADMGGGRIEVRFKCPFCTQRFGLAQSRMEDAISGAYFQFQEHCKNAHNFYLPA